MSAIDQRNIEFVNKVVNGEVYKTTNCADPDMGYITWFRDVSTLDEMLADVDKAINGQYDLIVDPDISNDTSVLAFITANGIEYWDEDGQNIIAPVCPLQDFRELLAAWRAFLLTPPLHNSKV